LLLFHFEEELWPGLFLDVGGKEASTLGWSACFSGKPWVRRGMLRVEDSIFGISRGEEYKSGEEVCDAICG